MIEMRLISKCSVIFDFSMSSSSSSSSSSSTPPPPFPLSSGGKLPPVLRANIKSSNSGESGSPDAAALTCPGGDAGGGGLSDGIPCQGP